MAQPIIHVLLVEDTEIAQIVETEHLIKQGCEVDLAENGNQALEKAMTNTYDLILMDLSLGDGPDGFDVTRQIKNRSEFNKKTPMVALTSHEESEYMKKADDVKIEHYFNKPFTLEDAKIIIDYIKLKKGYAIK